MSSHQQHKSGVIPLLAVPLPRAYGGYGEGGQLAGVGEGGRDGGGREGDIELGLSLPE